MKTDKEILRKLFKIAENQQKMIRKLAQIQPVLTVEIANDLISKVTGSQGYKATDASVKENEAYLTVELPPGKKPGEIDLVWVNIKDALVKYLASKGSKFAPGQPVKYFV